MRALTRLYKRLNLLQQQRTVKIILTVIMLVAAGAFFYPILHKSHSLDQQRRALISALTNQNLNERDEHALSFKQTGTVYVGGRTYGNEMLMRQADEYFDQDGNMRLPAVLAEQFLLPQRPEWMPRWMLDQPDMAWKLALFTAAWLALIVWMNLSLQFLITLVVCGVPAFILWNPGGWFGAVQHSQWGVTIAGIGVLLFTFALLTQVFLLLYRYPHQILAVAHTVIREASRNRVSVIFIVVLLVALPIIPLTLDADGPLRFRVQSFISRGLTLTFVLAAVMTIFLSCATVAFEIRDRQIWQIMTKPVGHFSYLVGKWLGVVTVNLILLFIAGLSIFTFVQYLRTQPVAPGMQGQIDLLQVNEQVLTARGSTRPDYPRLTSEQVQTRVNELIERDPELSLMEAVPRATRRNLAKAVTDEFNARQRSIPSGGAARTYTFSGLKSARASSAPLSLRYRFFIMGNDEHSTFRCVFIFNDDMNNAIEREYVPTITHSLPIGSDLVREDGTLSLTIVNPVVPPRGRSSGAATLFFEYEDGLELLYRVSSFEANFARAMTIMMVKLSLLSVLGIFCATFLSFPVACLFTFTVFLAGSIGPFLAIALEEYYPPLMREESWKDPGLVIVWLFQSAIRQIALGLVFALRSFGEFKPTQMVVEGRAISLMSVMATVLKLGVLWSGVTLVSGFLILRSRQLAIYSGHG